jgi:hypothetical protein
MSNDLQQAISAVVQRAPEWMRHDLLSKDKATRTRAEEAFAAIIVNAIAERDRS